MSRSFSAGPTEGWTRLQGRELRLSPLLVLACAAEMLCADTTCFWKSSEVRMNPLGIT